MLTVPPASRCARPCLSCLAAPCRASFPPSSSINLTRIESLPNKNAIGQAYDFFIDYEPTPLYQDIDDIKELLHKLGIESSSVTSGAGDWFPRKISDLDVFSDRILGAGADLQSDHPGFTDQEYLKRRREIDSIARNYKHGQPIPRVEYTKSETETWGKVYGKIQELLPTHACRQFQHIFPLLQEYCGYSVDNIPQLEDISNFLRSCTGFTLRPVAGLLSSRDFLNGLAFRVFHSTQYIRHHSQPLYTPEPDVCHELIGHVPLFCDKDFARFSQEIGLASLGASDEDITKLATCYWFTVEFGLCREGNEIKAFGAGLLSSFGELEYCLSDKPELRPFEPQATAIQEYPITTYQPVYFVAESFADAKEKMSDFAATLDRPFSVAYNPYTQSIDVIETREQLIELMSEIDTRSTIVKTALAKMGRF